MEPYTQIGHASDHISPFFSLPRELRDRIYTLVFQQAERASSAFPYVPKSSTHSKKRNKIHLVPIPPVNVPGILLCNRRLFSECYHVLVLTNFFVLEYDCQPVQLSPQIGRETLAIEYKLPTGTIDGDVFPKHCLGYALRLCPNLNKLIINFKVFRAILLELEESFRDLTPPFSWPKFLTILFCNQQCRLMVRDVFFVGAGLRNLTIPANLDSSPDEFGMDTGEGDCIITRDFRSELRLSETEMLQWMRQVWIECVRMFNSHENRGGFRRSIQLKGAEIAIMHSVNHNFWRQPRRTLTVTF
ncbi:hypothetical protein BT63DRAFT_415707 [Microthyrium microscopicum]|uniref:F-box domain-containing protein n=1 Tax=Microthyrium microscopicum TaxID=703497 RepID=A0A6A6U4T3_9PEZI|nr:hypothetical protein BT63DRAFT_415707 [Microthyrium microscopicum]